jgi:hypothetical protein
VRNRPARAGCDTGQSRARGAALVVALLIAFVLLGATEALAITRATVLARAQSWIDITVPYSQTHWFRGYRTDCSGFTSMSWKTTVGGHSYSYSTRSLHNVSSVVASAALLPGDALVKYDHHAIVFYGWADASRTTYIAYEQTGPATKTSLRSLAADIAYGYKPYRRRGITNDPPPWNALANPTFDVWLSKVPVWWALSGARGQSVCTRSVDIVKTGKSALELINPSSLARDVVSASQTASVTAGQRYTLSVWACTDGVPARLEFQIQFRDASGKALGTAMTTGAAHSIETTSLRLISLTATAPIEATVAVVSVRLPGGVDASGTAGTSAVLDDFRLYVSSPVTSSISISSSSTTRGHAVTLRGRVTAPIPVGTVRVFKFLPGRTSAVAVADRPLVKGVWSLGVMPALRGTYRFEARYLGYGPYGPITSGRVALKVR